MGYVRVHGWVGRVTGKVPTCILRSFYKSGHMTLLLETLNGFLLLLLPNPDSFPRSAGPGSADPNHWLPLPTHFMATWVSSPSLKHTKPCVCQSLCSECSSPASSGLAPPPLLSLLRGSSRDHLSEVATLVLYHGDCCSHSAIF